MSKVKLSAKTFTRGVTRNTDLITRCLVGYPEGLNPKAISAKTGINVGTVKSALPKMSNIKKVVRGVYKVLEEGDVPSFDLKDWNFHNCIMTVDCRWDSCVGVYDFGLVKVDLSVSKFGKGTCRLSSDWPLNVSSLCFVAGWFSDKVGVDFGDVMLSCVEFNRDFVGLRLDGVKCISIDSLVSQFKLYQKKRGLRVEHKTKVPIMVDSIVDMLSNNPCSVDLYDKLNVQRKELSRLSAATVQNTQLMLRLVDKFNMR